jgi:tetratricopeptide (TPR) repeat protein
MMKPDLEATQQQIPRRYLRRVPWLASLKSKDVDRVQHRLHRRQYTAGETILRRGVHGGFLGIIGAGQVDIIFQTPGGRQLVTALHPGDFFTLRSTAPSSAMVRAATSVVLWILDHADATALGLHFLPVSHSSPVQVSRHWLPVGWLVTPLSILQQRPRLVRLNLVVVAILLLWAALTPGRRLLADLHFLRGSQYLEQAQVDAALREFEAALRTNPTHAESYNALGCVYYQQGRLDQALLAFEHASRLVPNSDVIQNNLGLMHNHRGEIDQALESLHRAAELNGNVSQVYVNLGDLYLAEREWVNAGRFYREALRLNPKLPVTHHNLGVTYYRLHQWADARSEFEQALYLDPNLEAAYLGMGIIAFEQNQFSESQAALWRAVELDPEDAVAFFYLGLAHKSMGHQEQAIGAFGRALGLTSDPIMREQAKWHLKELWELP